MQNSQISNKLMSLASISEALEPNAETRERFQGLILEFANKFIDHLDEAKSYIAPDRPLEGLSINGKSQSLESILECYWTEVVQYGIKPASGGHIGYIPGGGIFSSALADYIAAVSNEYAGMYFGSPGAVSIENEIVQWLKASFQFPEQTVGNLCSGGSIGNLIALTAARDRHQIKNETIIKSVVYMSEQVHHCLYKALRIIGLEDIIIRHISLDENSRMDCTHLASRIVKDKAEGLKPFLIIGSAGTTDTGAIDPLDSIADIADEHKTWFHVDGAYGGLFYLLDSLKLKFKGINRADSLVVDPHKTLFLPYGTGAVLVKDREAVLHSQHYVANYMQDAYSEDIPLNPADTSPELTKHFRGLRLWLPLKLHGIEPFLACMEEKILLTHYFRNGLRNMGFELGPEPDLSVSYFWYPQGEKSDSFNAALMKKIHEDGRIFLSSSRIQDKFVIRMAILSFRTKRHTIDKTLMMIKECLDDLLTQEKG